MEIVYKGTPRHDRPFEMSCVECLSKLRVYETDCEKSCYSTSEDFRGWVDCPICNNRIEVFEHHRVGIEF